MARYVPPTYHRLSPAPQRPSRFGGRGASSLLSASTVVVMTEEMDDVLDDSDGSFPMTLIDGPYDGRVIDLPAVAHRIVLVDPTGTLAIAHVYEWEPSKGGSTRSADPETGWPHQFMALHYQGLDQ